MVAGSYVARNVQCLADDGRAVIIAVQGGVKAEFDAGQVLRRRPDDHWLHASASDRLQGRHQLALRERVWPLLESRAISPVIFKQLPASEAAAAHALMESGEHVGEIVLSW